MIKRLIQILILNLLVVNLAFSQSPYDTREPLTTKQIIKIDDLRLPLLVNGFVIPLYEKDSGELISYIPLGSLANNRFDKVFDQARKEGKDIEVENAPGYYAVDFKVVGR